MKHGTHPSPRQPLFATVATAALALLLGTSTQSASAAWHDGQSLTSLEEQWNTPHLTHVSILSPPGFEPTEECLAHFAVMDPLSPWGTIDYGGLEYYYSLPAGDSTIVFDVAIDHEIEYPLWFNSVQFFVQGSLCTSCSVEMHGYGDNYQVWRITYHPNYTTNLNLQDGAREFGLRLPNQNSGEPLCDVRFKAVMIGTTITNILGYYDAPVLPLYIMRDPPGGQSSSSISTTSSTCFGTSQSVTNDMEEGGWFKAKLGIAGSAGLFVTEDFEFYVEGGVSVTASQSQTSDYEYKTCIEQGSELTTSDDGTPDDVFYGSSIKYAYGMAIDIQRTGCGTFTKHAAFISQPFALNHSYHYTESYIRQSVIPQAQQQLAQLTPGSVAYKQAEQQLSVWHQMLDMNDSIKADAAPVITRSFNGGGTGQTYSLTRTTETMRSITYTASLSTALSLEFCAEIGGSGFSGGAEVKIRAEYGNGETNSNVYTNTMSYTLKDPDVYDNFDVIVGADNVFGTYTFLLDSATSRTSCRYEGGYHIDNPELSLGTPGNTSMTVNEVPIGTQANFPLIICNNSDTTRTYYLKFATNTNGHGAHMEASGTVLNTSDNGVFYELAGGECINPILYLTQPNAGVVDFDNINLYLYSLCDEEYPPYIRSYITISAHYGVGNVGAYCAPVSDVGTAQGDYVDGVQVANINNMSTGGVTGPSYTDYTSQFTTPLSRNAQKIITITSGTNAGDRFAAWIDYDHNGTFDANEKLGEFTNASAGEAQNIAFTVPNTATLGNTLLRVRGIGAITGEPSPLDPCFNYHAGETEDYAVVINANTPQDCAGVNNGPALPGTACDDSNANTGNDTWNANCACLGVAVDCAGTPGGSAVAGTPCDDGNPDTANDLYTANCACAGATFDCLGILGGTATQDSPCDDGDAGTGNDTWGPNCVCAGQLIDCLGVPGGTTLTGTPCDDGNPLSGGDAYNANCACVGAFATDCAGVEGGTAQPGTACDDNVAATGNDTYSVNCVCAGVPYDCAGTPGGTQLPGTPCDDGNSASTNDTFTADCGCLGELANDCAGVPGGTAQPGTACDDGNAATGNDVYNAFCTCAGEPIDCNGVVGGPTQPGFPCDDGNAATGGDVIDANCQCAGLLLDCLGVPGGTTTVGTACDDADANTSNDMYTANCICAGELANDCEGVAGGTAQPGTTCDDGDANTGNDVYSANCTCAGQLIDCEGTIGGFVLPGTPCDDGVACTVNDVRGMDCACSGTTITIGAVTGSSMVFGNTTNVYLVTPVANATSYNWALPNGWTTGDNGAFALVAEVSNTPGPVDLCVTAMVGACELTSCVTVTVDFNTGIATTNAGSGEWFTVQPNPSNGVFQLRPSTTGATPLRISIRNGLGQEVLPPFTVAGQRAIDMDLSDVSAGAYYLLATRSRSSAVQRNAGGEQQVIMIMVQH